MFRLSDRLSALPGYPLAEVATIKRRLLERGADVIDLGAGDADQPPPAPVVEAMQQAVRNPAMSRYGFQQGDPEFRRACVRWIERRFGARFDPDSEILPLLGSKEGLAHLPFAVLNPGDLAIVPEPGYQAYLGGTILAGGVPRIFPLRSEGGFLVQLDELPAETLRRTRLVYLNYPNNPTTAVAPRDYLSRTVALCREHGIVLAFDNPYCDLTFDGYRAPGIFEIEGAREVALEFYSMSKSYSMTGWRLGWVAGRSELINALSRIKSYVDTGPFLAVQRASVAALDRAEVLVPPLVEEFRIRRDRGMEALRTAGFELEPPRATMYLWIALPAGVPSAAFARRALEEHGVIVLPGSAFGASGEGFFRIALTVSADRIAEGARRLGACLAASIAGEPVLRV